MKKQLLNIILALTITSTAYAGEVSLKAGYSDVTCDYIQSGTTIDCAYEVKNRWAGLQAFVGLENHEVNQVGQLNTIRYGLLGKVYPIDSLWIGGGVGYLNNFIVESYDGDADIDDEIAYYAIMGKSFGNMFFEIEGRIADLDMETGLPYETEIEKHSRLNSITLKIGWRY